MLTRPQKKELVRLLADSLDVRLPPEEEARLRALVVHEVPSAAKVSWEELHRTGTFMVGVWEFTGSLEAEA